MQICRSAVVVVVVLIINRSGQCSWNVFCGCVLDTDTSSSSPHHSNCHLSKHQRGLTAASRRGGWPTAPSKGAKWPSLPLSYKKHCTMLTFKFDWPLSLHSSNSSSGQVDTSFHFFVFVLMPLSLWIYSLPLLASSFSEYSSDCGVLLIFWITSVFTRICDRHLPFPFPSLHASNLPLKLPNLNLNWSNNTCSWHNRPGTTMKSSLVSNTFVYKYSNPKRPIISFLQLFSPSPPPPPPPVVVSSWAWHKSSPSPVRASLSGKHSNTMQPFLC